MTLHDRWLRALSKRNTDTEAHVTQLDRVRERRQELAFTAARNLRDFRQVYGYKITPPFLWQHATVAAFILLNDIDEFASRQTPRTARPSERSPPIVDVDVAFEECVRCILACGVQMLLPRAIARMLYLTSIQSKKQLPETVEQMMQIMAEISWQPSDLRRLNSIYPNQGDELGMESLLRKFEVLGSHSDCSELREEE